MQGCGGSWLTSLQGLLCIFFRRFLGIRRGSWGLGKGITHIFRMSRKADLGNYLLINLPSVARKILEKTLLETMAKHMDSQMANCGWTIWEIALRRWLVWWVKEDQWLFTLTSTRPVTWCPCSQIGETWIWEVNYKVSRLLDDPPGSKSCDQLDKVQLMGGFW